MSPRPAPAASHAHWPGANWWAPQPLNLCLSTQLRNPQHRPVELFITASSLKIATFYEINHILFSWAPVERTEEHSM